MPIKGPHRKSARPLDRERAFEQIFSGTTVVLVGRWLHRLGVPSRDRSDLVQDVLLAAYESFASYDPERGRPERWLNRIAVHIASHYRDRARHRLEEPLADDFDAELDAPSPEEQMGSEHTRLLTLELLGRLGVELSSVLVAHDIEGVSMTEIALQHGIPVSTAYKRRARAVALFRMIAAERLSPDDAPRSPPSPAATSEGADPLA